MNLIVSASLNVDSRSRVLAREAHRALSDASLPAAWVDLAEHPLPFCDGGAAYHHENVARLRHEIARADALIVATPIYNYTVNAALKNLIELTGGAWENKVVGFLCAAGGESSYMSVAGLASSLMLDFRCVIVPRFVYATGAAFAGGRLVNDGIRRRVAELARTTGRMGALLRAAA